METGVWVLPSVDLCPILVFSSLAMISSWLRSGIASRNVSNKDSDADLVVELGRDMQRLKQRNKNLSI
jgi:hypothetical protein